MIQKISESLFIEQKIFDIISQRMAARRKLQAQYKKLKELASAEIRAWPKEENFFSWIAQIYGPRDTIWEGSVFRLSMEFPRDYPIAAPKVNFLTRVFHPNVYQDGAICIDILANSWNPQMNIEGILISLQSFLNDPNSSSPANRNAGELFAQDPKKYQQEVKAHNKKYALPEL